MFVSIWIGIDLDVERAAIEDELEVVFQGLGEVTGAGIGETGCHVDLEILADPPPPLEVYKLVEKALMTAGLTAKAKVRIDGAVFTYQHPEARGSSGGHI